MKLLIKQYIPVRDLPETALLIPSKQETILAVTHFDEAEKIPVHEDEFLCYRGVGKKKQVLITSTGLGSDSLLVIMNELFLRRVQRFFLIQESVSLDPQIPPGEVVLPGASLLYGTKKTVKLASLRSSSFKKNIKSLTVPLPLAFLETFHIKGKDYLPFKVLNFYDYFFMVFLNQHKLSGVSVNYVVGDLCMEKHEEKDGFFHKAMTSVMDLF